MGPGGWRQAHETALQQSWDELEDNSHEKHSKRKRVFPIKDINEHYKLIDRNPGVSRLAVSF